MTEMIEEKPVKGELVVLSDASEFEKALQNFGGDFGAIAEHFGIPEDEIYRRFYSLEHKQVQGLMSKKALIALLPQIDTLAERSAAGDNAATKLLLQLAALHGEITVVIKTKEGKKENVSINPHDWGTIEEGKHRGKLAHLPTISMMQDLEKSKDRQKNMDEDCARYGCMLGVPKKK